MATPGKPSKKELKRQPPSKTSFTSPFSSKWTPLPQDDMHFILNTLKDKLSSTGLEKKEVKALRPRRRKKERKAATEDVAQVTQREPDAGRNGWTDAAARRQLAIGINEATKALERNQLRLLLVCKSVKPPHMTNHLMALSASRGVPACQVPRLSRSVSEPLGLKSVLALGFKLSTDDHEVFRDTVEAITPRVPALEVGWLRGGEPGVTPGDTPGVTPGDTPGDAPGDTPGVTPGVTPGDAPGDPSSMEEEAGEARGQKRKLEAEPEESPSSCTLLPLKVKKIVANPAKKRKVKPKKQKVK